MRYLEAYKGAVFGVYTVIGPEDRNTSSKRTWKCVCNRCSQESFVVVTVLFKGMAEKCWHCRKGIHEPSSSHVTRAFMSQVKNNANTRGISFKLSIDYLNSLFLEQKQRCAYTGVKLKMKQKVVCSPKDWNASLDRIDSSLAYIEGNVQWVHKKVNMAKREMSHLTFIRICQAVANKFPNM